MIKQTVLSITCQLKKAPKLGAFPFCIEKGINSVDPRGGILSISLNPYHAKA